MFKAKVICLGKYKESAFQSLEQEFLKRLRVYCKIVVDELKEASYKSAAQMEQSRAQEAAAVLSRVPKDAVMVLLDEKGVLRDSTSFAQFIDRISTFGREIVFVLGSGIGSHTSLKERANHIISLSALTFTHNFARVLLLEQLYRACTIVHGKEYHK